LWRDGGPSTEFDLLCSRPTLVETLLSGHRKARAKSVPVVTIDDIINDIVANDLDQARQPTILKMPGFSGTIGKEN